MTMETTFIFHILFLFLLFVWLFFWDIKLLKKSVEIKSLGGKIVAIIDFVGLVIILVGFRFIYEDCYPDKVTTWIVFGVTVLFSLAFAILFFGLSKFLKSEKGEKNGNQEG